jgi:hypothetical protein
MLLLLLFLCFHTALADGECCEESYECSRPDIVVSVSESGVSVNCGPRVVCSWVESELSTCSCGKVWNSPIQMQWQDIRFKECFTYNIGTLLKLDGTLRWWSDTCMGHERVSFEVESVSSFLDVVMHYSEIVHMEEVHRYYNYSAIARSGTEGSAVAQSLKSTMYYEVTMDEFEIGVHMEIDVCTLEILSSGSSDSEILTTYHAGQHSFNYNISFAEPNGERVSYKAIMDDEYYSPWQRIMCSYTMKNGTTTLDTFQHGHSYMIYDPFDSGERYT